MKFLIEKRNDLQAKAEGIIAKAKTENRTITAEEKAEFDAAIKKIGEIDDTIAADEITAKFDRVKVPDAVTGDEADVKDFANYIRNKISGIVDTASQLTSGDNGAVIPASIANKIIAKVIEISPIYAMATHYDNVKGTLTIPKVDTSTDDITVGYATEFSSGESHSFNLGTISLSGYLGYALTLVSKSLINNSDFALVDYVVARMAEKIAVWIEGQLINGTASNILGIARSYDSTNMKVTLAKKSSIKADELIDLQDLIPDKYQANAIWVMSRATRTAIRKLKDSDGQYLLNRDIAAPFGYTLLGKPVYISENAPALGTAGNLAVIYGDMSGLAVKTPCGMETMILNERYADQHAVGVQTYFELDAKVENVQKIACASCGSADT